MSASRNTWELMSQVCMYDLVEAEPFFKLWNEKNTGISRSMLIQKLWMNE